MMFNGENKIIMKTSWNHTNSKRMWFTRNNKYDGLWQHEERCEIQNIFNWKIGWIHSICRQLFVKGNELNLIQPNWVVVTFTIDNGKVNNMMKYQSSEETGIIFNSFVKD